MSEGESKRDMALAYALLRLVLGVNLLMHGLSRIVAGGFEASLATQFQKTPLPAGMVHAFGVTLPFAEAVIGAFLVLGLAMRYVCILGLLLIAVLTFGSALIQNWNAAGIQLLYALVYAVLLGLRQNNVISVDGLFGRTGDAGGRSSSAGRIDKD